MSYGIPLHAMSCEHDHDMDYPPCPRCAAAGQPPLTDSELAALEAVVAKQPLLTRLLAGFLDARTEIATLRTSDAARAEAIEQIHTALDGAGVPRGLPEMRIAALVAERGVIGANLARARQELARVTNERDAEAANAASARREWARSAAERDALAAEVDRLAMREGHGQPCYFCSAACDSAAGDPGRWPIPLCHGDEPGVVKWHHAGCVSSRLRERDAAITAARADADALRGSAAMAQALAAELERWRHGVQIEGDYVCPDSLALIEARAALEALRSEREAQVTLYMGTAEEIKEAIDACERLADGGEFRKTLITEILRVRAMHDAVCNENEALRERLDLVEKRTAVPPPREEP